MQGLTCKMPEQQIIHTYNGRNVNLWKVKDYIVSENRGKWFCTCSLTYKRDPLLVCKHIKQIKRITMNNLKQIYEKQIKIYKSLVSDTKDLLKLAKEGMDEMNVPEKRKQYVKCHHQLKAMLYEYEEGVQYWEKQLERFNNNE